MTAESSGKAGGISPVVERFRSGQVPAAARLAAARGALPLPPEDLLMVLFILRKDPEEEVRAAVIETVRGLGEDVLNETLGRRETHPAVLDFYARVLQGRPEAVGTILGNASTHDKTVEYLADKTPPENQERIVVNQVRLARSPAIAEALRRNPRLDPSVLRRLEEVLEIIARRPRPGAETAPPPEASPPAAEEPRGGPPPAPRKASGEAEEEDEDLLGALEELEKEALEDTGEALVEEAIDEELVEEGDLVARIATMGVPEKLQLARLGTAQARSVLIRDASKSVREAVLDSPKLTDQEIETFAGNRSLPEEVLRLIGQNREWVKNTAIMHRLIQNPKTPVGVSMRFLPRLTTRDLQDLTRNRNIPAALRAIATRLFEEKTKPKNFKKKH